LNQDNAAIPDSPLISGRSTPKQI